MMIRLLLLFSIIVFKQILPIDEELAVDTDASSFVDERSQEQISPEQPITIGDELKTQKKEIKEKKIDKKDVDVMFVFGDGKNTVDFSFRNRTEAFYGRSLQLLSPNKLDQVVYAQYTFDLKTSASFGNSLRSMVVVRHKGRWGNPNTIARTTESTIRLADDVTGNHRHFLGKQIFWLREGWIDISLNDAFCLNACNRHYLTLGAFSFRLGRGIALGDAYATSPGLLGFFSNNVIDQYAPGILFHGDVKKNKLSYDVYLGLLENLSDSFDNVNEEIYAMQMHKGRRCPQRGFGKLNYVLASRLNFNLINPDECNGRKFTAEPYILYNFTPEQDVEFPSDANSKLITPGFALEYNDSKWEAGFEFAHNFGRQCVRPWDRNKLVTKRDGTNAALTLYYTEIKNGSASGPAALVTDANKKIVNNSPQGIEFNGKQIGTTGLYNDVDRFRAGYRNDYLGFMFVADASYKVKDNFKVAATVGYATGDEDPNVDLDDLRDSEVDGNYKGFIPLQGSYTGKRVPSLFIITNNTLVRPLSVPSNQIPEEDRFAQNISDFTNVVFGGAGCDWNPKWCQKDVKINPNVLAYWQEHATKKFSLKLGKTINEFASKFLGVEFNIFTEIKLLKNLKGYFIAGVFLPGSHYHDIKGKPLNKAQIEELKSVNDTGFLRAKTPLLGTNPAVMLNWGFEYIF